MIYIKCIYIFEKLSILFCAVMNLQENRDIYLDIGIYMGCTFIILVVLLFNFRLPLNKRYEWLTFSTIWLAISALVLMGTLEIETLCVYILNFKYFPRYLITHLSRGQGL